MITITSKTGEIIPVKMINYPDGAKNIKIDIDGKIINDKSAGVSISFRSCRSSINDFFWQISFAVSALKEAGYIGKYNICVNYLPHGRARLLKMFVDKLEG